MKRKTKNVITIIKNISFFVLGALFTWLLIDGIILMLPVLAGTFMIATGFVGLVILGYMGRKKFK
ncbi:MAG TPA: hypothetical protein ENH46_05650 [Candidatus Pacearchaeota archaeon]|nr:hypothetical protein [Candidatus Pacearchaeota archaeon]